MTAVDEALTAIADATGQDRQDLVYNALLDWLEAQVDIRTIEQVLAQNNPTLSSEDVKREPGLHV